MLQAQRVSFLLHHGKEHTHKEHRKEPLTLCYLPVDDVTNKLQPYSLKTTEIYSGSWKSKIKESVGMCSLQGLMGDAFLASSNFWRPQVFLGLWLHHPNLSVFTWTSPSFSFMPLSSVPWPKVDPSKDLSAKTLFPKYPLLRGVLSTHYRCILSL